MAMPSACSLAHDPQTMAKIDTPLHSIAFLASLLCFIVGLIHLWFSFEDKHANLHWQKGNFIEETNQGWQTSFALTPQAIVHHFQPALIGWFALSHHIGYVKAWSVYGSWIQMCFWYVFVAVFGCFGYAGNLGILAGAFSLLTAAIAAALAVVDNTGAPQPVLF